MATARPFDKVDEIDSREGQVQDFVSGHWVKAGPEEVEAVQVFSRRLVEDYDYPKLIIQTRPQYRVRSRPSDEAKSFPVDIAVFRSTQKTEDELFMIVECKKMNRKEGEHQLRLYMDMSAAEIGVWFNGDEHLYLRKVHHKDGRRTYDVLPNIPRYGQRIEDIGLFRRKDLKKPSNLKAVFRDLRNHLAGMTTGITRDEALAQEIINVLFCKIYDERNTFPDKIVEFRAGVNEPYQDVQERIQRRFEQAKNSPYGDVFDPNDAIKLDPSSLAYVVGELQNYCIMEADRDAIGDAFEVFIGPALRGAEGQFFTPRNVVEMMVEIVDPKPGEKIIDPACGSGGFLVASLLHVWRRLREEAEQKGWSVRDSVKWELEIASDYFRGIDKDAFLAKVCKAYMALIGDGRGGVFCHNTLEPVNSWPEAMKAKIKPGTFDVVFTNPPFGKKIVVKGEPILSQFELGYKWRKDKEIGVFAKTAVLHQDQPPQILFLERCLQLLKPGGRLGIVMPESVLGNPSYAHLMTWLLANATVKAIITLPEALFKTTGKIGTHTKVCALIVQKGLTSDDEGATIFMADARWCGHDSRGNPTIRRASDGTETLLDDMPIIAESYERLVRKGARVKQDHLGFLLQKSEISNLILVPKYYDPEIADQLQHLSQTHDLVRVGDLIDTAVLAVTTGVEVGKMAYGTGPIPFIRTSDISNWELKADPKHGVSTELYNSLKKKLDVRAGDILMVRDGTYLIGTVAIVTESDTRIIFQSHIYKIRVRKPDVIDPWLLFACLNTPIVKRQIRSKQFTQDIIDTLGNRLSEILIPLPKDVGRRAQIAKATRETVEARVALRNRAKQIVLDVEGVEIINELDQELLDSL